MIKSITGILGLLIFVIGFFGGLYGANMMVDKRPEGLEFVGAGIGLCAAGALLLGVAELISVGERIARAIELQNARAR